MKSCLRRAGGPGGLLRRPGRAEELVHPDVLHGARLVEENLELPKDDEVERGARVNVVEQDVSLVELDLGHRRDESRHARGPRRLRTPVSNIEYFPPNFEGLVLGCIDADFCK